MFSASTAYRLSIRRSHATTPIAFAVLFAVETRSLVLFGTGPSLTSTVILSKVGKLDRSLLPAVEQAGYRSQQL